MTERREGRLRRRHSGVALIIVLASLSVLGAFAMAFVSNMRVEAKLAIHGRESASMRAALEGGVHAGIAGLVHGGEAWSWPRDGLGVPYTVGGYAMTVHIYDELGKVDLNTAPAPVLGALFEAASGERGALIARAVLEHRARAWEKHGSGVPERPWESVSELRGLEGMTEEAFRTARPALTVHSGSHVIAGRAASELALHAARADPGATGQERNSRRTSGEVYTVRAQAHRRDGREGLTMEALVWIVEHLRGSYHILEWHSAAEAREIAREPREIREREEEAPNSENETLGGVTLSKGG